MLVFGGVTWQGLNEGLLGPQESSQSDGQRCWPGGGLERILWIVPPAAHLSRSVYEPAAPPGVPCRSSQNPRTKPFNVAVIILDPFIHFLFRHACIHSFVSLPTTLHRLLSSSAFLQPRSLSSSSPRAPALGTCNNRGTGSCINN